MRNFTGLLLFENIFDFVPEGDPDITNLANTLFNPNVLISELDCGTTLGKFENINYESEGLVELATDSRLSFSRIQQLLKQGKYQIATRHTSTCISKEGVCAKCYGATFPDAGVLLTKNRVNVSPEYLVNAEVIRLEPGTTKYPTVTEPGSYSKVYAFINGQLVDKNSYSIDSNGLLEISITITQPVNLVLRCMAVQLSPYLIWLANTYAGSILGLEPLPSQQLPIRSLLLSSMLTENRLQLISEFIKQVKDIPSTYAEYVDSIKDPLEKALYMLALYCIYSNVTS